MSYEAHNIGYYKSLTQLTIINEKMVAKTHNILRRLHPNYSSIQQ